MPDEKEIKDEEEKETPKEEESADETSDDDSEDKDEEEKETPKEEDKEEEFKDDDTEPEGTVAPKAPEKEEKKDEEESEEDDLEEEDKEKFGKLIDKRIKPLEESLQSSRVETDLQNLFATNPEYKPYEARIRRFVTHPNRIGAIRSGLPVKAVALEAIEPYLAKITIAKSKAADAKANLTKTDGSSSRPSDSPKVDYEKMSNKEIEETAELVKQGRYKPS